MAVIKTIDLEIGREDSEHGVEKHTVECRFNTLERIERVTGMNCDILTINMQRGIAKYSDIANALYAILLNKTKYSKEQLGELVAGSNEDELKYIYIFLWGVIGSVRNAIPANKVTEFRQQLGEALAAMRHSLAQRTTENENSTVQLPTE